MTATIRMTINEKIYVRDPEQTALGRKIIDFGIVLIDEIGFEAFTFKKLADRIDSTEASIYRYFENKHNFLVYLVNWYWNWLEFQIDYQINNITDIRKKLSIAIKIISEVSSVESPLGGVDKKALHRIVVMESPKAYHTKGVDAENKDGFFKSYKSLCKKIAEMIKELYPNHPYPFALSSTMLEASQHQLHFSKHLPSLTEIRIENDDYNPVVKYLEFLVFEKQK
ncbi:MAG: TetR/AcrR family transcriptional regulator [Raineya sp.]|jgi:AcrR family transcriptional regulator|nr:TetR/AcrR family transcriptional regulator [Raineya sp.]